MNFLYPLAHYIVVIIMVCIIVVMGGTNYGHEETFVGDDYI